MQQPQQLVSEREDPGGLRWRWLCDDAEADNGDGNQVDIEDHYIESQY